MVVGRGRLVRRISPRHHSRIPSEAPQGAGTRPDDGGGSAQINVRRQLMKSGLRPGRETPLLDRRAGLCIVGTRGHQRRSTTRRSTRGSHEQPRARARRKHIGRYKRTRRHELTVESCGSFTAYLPALVSEHQQNSTGLSFSFPSFCTGASRVDSKLDPYIHTPVVKGTLIVDGALLGPQGGPGRGPPCATSRREYRGPTITCPHGVPMDAVCALCGNDIVVGIEGAGRPVSRRRVEGPAPSGCRCAVQ